MDFGPGITAELKVPNVQPWSAEVWPWHWPWEGTGQGRGSWGTMGQLKLPALIGSLFVRLAAGVAQQLSDSASGGTREDRLSKLGQSAAVVEPGLAVVERLVY